jgi:hypothetical protein
VKELARLLDQGWHPDAPLNVSQKGVVHDGVLHTLRAGSNVGRGSYGVTHCFSSGNDEGAKVGCMPLLRLSLLLRDLHGPACSA